MAPLLSVIVPVYNVAEYLPSCLQSLLAQTLTDLEVIVVDDGSPDECGEIADAFARRDPRIRVLHTTNQGLGRARNNGAAVAQGRYLAFADSDDLIPARAYELMVSTLEATGSDFAAGNAWRLMPDGELLPSWTHAGTFDQERLKTSIVEYPDLIRDRMVWNKVYRRSFWDANGFEFPAIRYEDYPVTLPAHLAATSVDVLSERVYLWRQRGDTSSITQLSADLSNVVDRVTSAEMTLDALSAGTPQAIVERLHGYLTDVDLVAVAGAYAAADDADKPQFAEQLVRLARRLDGGGKLMVGRAIHAAARRRSFKAVEALLAARERGKAVASRSLKPSRRRRLRGVVEEIADTVDGMRVSLRLKLRDSLLRRSRVGARLGELSLPVTRDRAGRYVVELPDGLDLPQDARLPLVLHAALPPLMWEGPIDVSTDLLPAARQRSDGTWNLIHNVDGVLGVLRTGRATEASLSLDDDGASVHVESSAVSSLAVLRPRPSAPLLVPVANGVGRIEWADLLESDPPDNPSTGLSVRPIVALTHTPDALPSSDRDPLGTGRESLHLVVAPATGSATVGTHHVSVIATAHATAALSVRHT